MIRSFLGGYSRSLMDYGDEWEVEYVTSGNEALVKLSQCSFDAIITDMHMPGMDGIQLLDIVRQKTPNVMRFVLSGNVSDIQTYKSTHLVHQMIPKPCDMEKIHRIVERACRLRDMLANPQLLHIITGIKNLPSVPIIYHKLVKELQSENTSPQIIGNIIAQDAAMTAKILQLVNSAFFGLSDNISSPQRAVTILGLNTVKALVLSIQVFSEYQGRGNLPLSVDAIWKHSMLVSNLAYDMTKSMQFNAQERDDVRVSGMLHDIGKLLFFKTPEVFQQIRYNKTGLTSIESEYQALGTSHAEMGAYLLGAWGLPDSIVEAVTYHHNPKLQITTNHSCVNILYTANGLVNMCQYDKNINYAGYLDVKYLEKIGFIQYLDQWIEMTKTMMDQVE